MAQALHDYVHGARTAVSEECSKLPVRELQTSTRRFLARWLDPPTEACNEQHVIKNWEGLAELMNFDYQTIQNFENSRKSSTESVIQAYSLRQNATVGHLITFLNQLERYDIIEDSSFINMLERDLEKYKEREERKQIDEDRLRREADASRPVQVPRVTSQFEDEDDIDQMDRDTDQYEEMVVDDIETGRKTYFDAFVSYCHDDLPFVQEMIRMLETVHGLKLCVDARDLLAGGSRHFITARLIADRCRKVILVMSPNFLRSPECEFQAKVAVSLSPGAKRKILIPILFKFCKMPLVLQHVCLVDYTKIDLAEWFWGRLAASLKESRKHSRLIPPEDLRNLADVEMDLNMDYKISNRPDINTLDISQQSMSGWGQSDNTDLYRGNTGRSNDPYGNEQTVMKSSFSSTSHFKGKSDSPKGRKREMSDSSKSMSPSSSQNSMEMAYKSGTQHDLGYKPPDDKMYDPSAVTIPFNREAPLRQPFNVQSRFGSSAAVGSNQKQKDCENSNKNSSSLELPVDIEAILSKQNNDTTNALSPFTIPDAVHIRPESGDSNTSRPSFHPDLFNAKGPTTSHTTMGQYSRNELESSTTPSLFPSLDSQLQSLRSVDFQFGDTVNKSSQQISEDYDFISYEDLQIVGHEMPSEFQEKGAKDNPRQESNCLPMVPDFFGSSRDTDSESYTQSESSSVRQISKLFPSLPKESK